MAVIIWPEENLRRRTDPEAKNGKSNRLFPIKKNLSCGNTIWRKQRARKSEPGIQILIPSLAGNSTRQPLASPAWQQPCCNKSWLSFDSKTLFSGGPRPIALTFESSAPPCVVATQAAAADCSAMIHNLQVAGFILRETSRFCSHNDLPLDFHRVCGLHFAVLGLRLLGGCGLYAGADGRRDRRGKSRHRGRHAGPPVECD